MRVHIHEGGVPEHRLPLDDGDVGGGPGIFSLCPYMCPYMCQVSLYVSQYEYFPVSLYVPLYVSLYACKRVCRPYMCPYICPYTRANASAGPVYIVPEGPTTHYGHTLTDTIVPLFATVQVCV